MSALSPAEMTAVRQADSTAATSTEVLAYRIGEAEYGLGILGVQEIRSFEKPTRIANAPAHLLGVINLRGAIVPVHDLRTLLGSPNREFTANTVVIMLYVGKDVVGVVVDAVTDVINLSGLDVRPSPAVGAVTDAYVSGVVSLGEGTERRTVFLLDVAALLKGR